MDNKQEDSVDDIITSRQIGPHNLHLAWTFNEEMQMMFIRMIYSQMVTEKLVEAQGIGFLET